MNEALLTPEDLRDYMRRRGIPGEVVEMKIPTPTVETAAKAANTSPECILKSILFLVEDQPVLAVTSGTQPVERRAIARLYGVGRKRVRLAAPQQVLEIAGFEVGAMPPFGHRTPLPTLLDRKVLQHPEVYGGGGAENTLVRLNTQDLLMALSPKILDLHDTSGKEAGAVSLRLLAGAVLVVLLVAGFYFVRWAGPRMNRSANVIAWLRDPSSRQQWSLQPGDRCGDAPFIFPTAGFPGFLWDDSFRPGHRHSGIDVFGGAGLNNTHVIAAYPGYLTRMQDWKSTVIIRHPADPLKPDRQIWTYYTHMADPHGESYIVPEYPPGTYEVFVEAGELLGYQGNYSGSALKPTGIHLHFSVVLDDGSGKFLNELEIENTLDPSPYLGLPLNANLVEDEIPQCIQQNQGQS